MKKGFTPLDRVKSAGRTKGMGRAKSIDRAKTKSYLTGFTPLDRTKSIISKTRSIDRVESIDRTKSKSYLTGFTLIEIMIVIALVSALAALAVPGVLRSRMNANETGAISSLRTISNGSQAFYANIIPHTYPSQLTDLISPTSTPPYIDSVLAGGKKQGYDFTYQLVDAESFTILADPVTFGWTGGRHFFVDETGVIRATTEDREATSSDPAV